MDPVTKMMNLVVPPLAFMSLFFFLPSLYLYRLFLSFLSSLRSENMESKVVVITGASSGIGEQLAYQYAKRGACLVLVARREERVQKVADRAREMGSPEAVVVPADVSKAEDCRRFIDVTINHFGRLDHLVNNAGITSMSLLEEYSDITNSRPIMDINFWGSVYPTYFAIPHLRKNNGRVVVVSSSAGYLPMPRMSFYCASKAALTNFYEALGIEFGNDIGVTIATPGFIESEMTQGKILNKYGNFQIDQEMRDVQLGLTPVESSEDCAKATVDAALKRKRYITEPFWFRTMFLFRFFAPEVMDLACYLLYVTKTGAPVKDALSKKLLDLTGAKNLLYPASIRSQPETSTPATVKVKKTE